MRPNGLGGLVLRDCRICLNAISITLRDGSKDHTGYLEEQLEMEYEEKVSKALTPLLDARSGQPCVQSSFSRFRTYLWEVRHLVT
jgi:hypothetical protein